MIVCPLHWYWSPARVEAVATTMETRGAPVLRGHLDPEWPIVLLAEGTHRIRAAHLLVLVPMIVPVRWWRSPAALVRARFCAARFGLAFERISLAPARAVG